MQIKTFEDIVAWQKAKLLTMEVYKSTRTQRDQGFSGQIQRASVSVMNNIAEGFERRSNKEFKQFLFIAKGSCGEVRSMLILGGELGVFSEPQSKKLILLSTEISKMLSGLIKKL
jgi:four helix bundle protein